MRVLTFLRGTEVSLIRVTENQILFARNVRGQPMYSTIEGLRLNPTTIVKEFPDLKGKSIDTIKKEGIKRFKEHISKLKSEQAIEDYLKKDLAKHGHKLIMRQKQGFRPEKVK
jgi:hypothetical protein